jgi:flagellar motor switch protein FliN
MPDSARTPHIERILALEVPIVVRLGVRTLRVSDVTALVPGSIIELPKNADTELDLMVNNQVVGTGLAVKVGENFGLRITTVGDVPTRVAALGENASSAA